ncbi:hypothetical protein [Pseudomonas kurunegalensis]|uniref:hypothetical protein n=1 Tax=Pseudomonas TaxID=286 RepID=UPI0035567681
MPVALFWYENAHRYREFQNLYEDAHLQHEKFSAWQKDAMALERRLRQEGQEPVRVCTTPKLFRQWCDAHHMGMNASSRSAFARAQIVPAQETMALGEAVALAHDEPGFLKNASLVFKSFPKR